MAAKKKSFEQMMQRLDEIVKHLEKGDLPLEETLKVFQEGTELAGACGKLLDEAEQQVVRLKKGSDGEPVELPFEEEMQ